MGKPCAEAYLCASAYLDGSGGYLACPSTAERGIGGGPGNMAPNFAGGPGALLAAVSAYLFS